MPPPVPFDRVPALSRPVSFPARLRALPWAMIIAAIALTLAKLGVYALLAPRRLDMALCQFDCIWYVGVATQGYDLQTHLVFGFTQANWAFFPLYPALIAGLDGVGLGSPVTRGFVVSTFCFVGMMLLGARYRAVTRQEHCPRDWLLLMTAWPYGLYFHAEYTEALYGILLVTTLLMLARQRRVAAGWATALITATRPTGILLVVWIGIDGLRRVIRSGRGVYAWHFLVPAAIAPLGLLVFMAMLDRKMGDPLAFLHIQAGWLHRPSNPLTVLLDGFRPSHWHDFMMLPYQALWALLGFAAAGFLLAKRRCIEAWLVGATIILALSSGLLESMPRFVAGNPAFMFAVADVLALIRWPVMRYVVLLALVDIEFVLVQAWYQSPLFLM